MNEDLMQGYVNPLQCLEIDDFNSSDSQTEPTIHNILEFLCTPGTPSNTKALINRYNEINKKGPALFIVPAENSILTKLVWPLRHAKSSYMIGNYLGTIALCGMVSEMISILIFDTSNGYMSDKNMSETDQASLFGSKF